MQKTVFFRYTDIAEDKKEGLRIVEGQRLRKTKEIAWPNTTYNTIQDLTLQRKQTF